MSALIAIPFCGIAEPAALEDSDQTLIFVSLSMPEASLKALYQEAEQQGAVLVLRGLKDNSFKRSAEALKILGIGVQIDPTLFEKYAIQSVPTFVRTRGSEYDSISGNISLVYALQRFKENI
jgi:conjugal transfer pilus assembly protein TrbC